LPTFYVNKKILDDENLKDWRRRILAFI